MAGNKSLYLTNPQLKAELERCLTCKNKPCMNACPVHCSPQEFIACAKEGNFSEAVKVISRNNPMGQTCGLICPDKFCMKACTRSHIDFAVNIPRVQATIMEKYRTETDFSEYEDENGLSVAVIGVGPAGIAAAAALSKRGYKITVFEAEAEIGGALNLIPENRLPHSVVEKDWRHIFNLERIELKLNTRANNPDALLEIGFDGVIVATGEPNCTKLGIEGEENLVSYMDYLRRPEEYISDGNIAIIGGGAVAVDCALTARENGAYEVEMFVRRKLSDMKVTQSEYLELIDAGIDITTMTSPVKAVKKSDGTYSLFTCKNRFEDGRLRPIPDSVIERSGFSYIIKAVGSYAERKEDADRIIYAGDCKHGGSTLVEAIASGQNAAELLHQKLSRD